MSTAYEAIDDLSIEQLRVKLDTTKAGFARAMRMKNQALQLRLLPRIQRLEALIKEKSV